MDRKKYQRDYYANSWIHSKHRDTQYNPDIGKFILNLVIPDSLVCDIGIGDGLPIAQILLESGMNVYGVDVSPKLIDICKNNFPQIDCKTGNAEKIPYGNDMFHLTYCVNTIWYVPNTMKAINELIRVTKPGGMIVFDIMNQYHVKISKLHRRLIFENTTMLGKGQKIIKNIVKKVLFPKYGSPNWHYVVDQTPLYPDLICKMFPRDIRLFTYNNSFIEINEKEPENYKFEKYSRIIFGS
jgi:ubiquinone/menaquinone biosynthesis C-methylase UbiE